MSGGSAGLTPLTLPGERPRLPRTLRLNHTVLCSGIVLVLMCPALGVGLWLDDQLSVRPAVLYGATAFMALMSLGGVYLVAGWFHEWLKVTDRGFDWHELFRHRKLNWCDVKRAVWVPEKGTARIRFYSATGKLTLFLTQFRRADQPRLMQLIRESVPEDRQEGWGRIAEMRTKRSGEPVRNGDRWLGAAGAFGFLFALLMWLAMRGHVPPLFALPGAMPGIILCPVLLLTGLLDLLRRRYSPWLAAALVLSGLGCVFTLMAILHLIRPA